ncbi:sensor histidine kinase [Tenacibaculum ovolyticum]|uniref:sensor histidine kinase n=1 Tax=Tenacibaculum ovolyticum TaxID=104270 RepID=UPI0022F3E18C|nr:sensor histidine kinase [Tenacibaculum ovolyticum]WBX76357.1 sensor histidine kinase [Tenacibaculum ovolyticum]
MNDKQSLLLIVTYAIIFLFVFLIAIIIFIVKSRNDRIKIQEKKKEIEIIAKQKTILLKEVHHRVKNNLQLISGLLYLQSVKHKNTEIIAMVDESQRHINSIALVHEMLYKDDTMSLVPMEKYLKELSSKLFQVSHKEEIGFKLNVSHVSLSVDYATTLGLLVNELIINSLKHAFVNKRGVITISLSETDKNDFLFTYADNGIGLDDEKDSKKTMGQRLIKMLAEEIEADLVIKNEKGLAYSFNFKIKNR